MCSYSKPSSVRRLAGHTLPETIIAVSLVGVMFISLYAGFSSGFSLLRAARENLRATEILTAQTERIRLLNWSQVLDPAQYLPASFVVPFDPREDAASTDSLLYYGSIETTTPADWPAAYRDRIRLITISLTWTNSGGNQSLVRHRQVQTCVARYGLQSYLAAP